MAKVKDSFPPNPIPHIVDDLALVEIKETRSTSSLSTQPFVIAAKVVKILGINQLISDT